MFVFVHSTGNRAVPKQQRWRDLPLPVLFRRAGAVQEVGPDVELPSVAATESIRCFIFEVSRKEPNGRIERRRHAHKK